MVEDEDSILPQEDSSSVAKKQVPFITDIAVQVDLPQRVPVKAPPGQLSRTSSICDGARARHLPNSAMLLPYSANLRLARLPLAPWRLPFYIYLLWS